MIYHGRGIDPAGPRHRVAEVSCAAGRARPGGKLAKRRASAEPIHKRVAGMDVHRMEHVVTILVAQEDGAVVKETRTFGAFRRDMRALVAWPSCANRPAHFRRSRIQGRPPATAGNVLRCHNKDGTRKGEAAARWDRLPSCACSRARFRSHPW